jgi:two-component system, chemotaxis family, sensor kinase CheA
MSDLEKVPSRRARARQSAFLCGLALFLAATAGYIWIQRPVRNSVELQRQLAQNVGRIMMLDEILTMSARMAASARDNSYEQRYNAHVNELDKLIQATLALVPDEEVAAAVSSTDEANQRLVAMETRSFELDGAGRHAEALQLLEGAAYRADKLLYAQGMERAFGRLGQLTADRRAAMERWDLMLQILAVAALALVLAAWALEQRERRRQAMVHAAELEQRVVERTVELAQRNQAMRLVLDAVQEGLVGVDKNGWMSSERSALLHRWFGPVTGRLQFADYVRSHDPGFAAWFELQLDQLRDGFLPIEVCVDQMPPRLRVGERTLLVSYEPILDNGAFDSLLVILVDITARIERERSEAEQRDLIRALEHIGRDRTGFLNFFHSAQRMVAELVSPSTTAAATSRLLHTLKGNAGQFGILTLADLCHVLEEHLREGGEFTAQDRETLHVAWLGLADRIGDVVGDHSHRHLAVERSDYNELVQLVNRRRKHESILSAISAWELDPVQARLDRLADGARALADRLGKPGLQVVCSGNGLRASNAEWAPLWAACVHLIRNAVDHGIESPAARAAAGKSEAGHLALSAAREADELVIRIGDDGRGIDWGAVGRKAAELNLPFESEAERVAALFHDRVSSRAEVTDVSGRGIGLAAVHEEVKRLGGALAVNSRIGQGTTVEMRFPAAAMRGATSPADRSAAAAARRRSGPESLPV